jgi:geranylgeranyl diphosphate synthase type I
VSVGPFWSEGVVPPEPDPTSASAMADERELAAVEALMKSLCSAPGTAGPMAVEHLATGGKRLRARLALAASEALDVPRATAVGWAAACELLHNGTLVHDDLQDGDRQRRGHPTVWVRHGAAQAINVGDLMLVLPYEAVAAVPAPDAMRWSLALALGSRTAAVVRGQADEQSLTGRGAIAWDEYERSAVGKTSALFELPVLGAALLAGKTTPEAEGLSAPFSDLGILFQMQDDVLDLYGDKGRGLVGSDLYEGKVSCLVVEHLARHPGEAAELLALLRAPREETPAAGVERFVERFRTGGALAAVLARLEGLRAGIEGHAALATEPRLLALAKELVETVLEPIRNVRAG